MMSVMSMYTSVIVHSRYTGNYKYSKWLIIISIIISHLIVHTYGILIATLSHVYTQRYT